jgi:flagellar biosynthesis component FlhA
MPGKQMADLSAGLIDEKEARRRRQTLEDEGGFFGAMDGASKFVRGDAIAGLLVVFINIIGGMIIGIARDLATILEGVADGIAGSRNPVTRPSTCARVCRSRHSPSR